MITTKTKNALSTSTPSKPPQANSTKYNWNYKGGFDRNLLPNSTEYYSKYGLKLTGKGAWRDAICPFHHDSKPSLRINVENGAFKCMACGAHGGDVLAFHMQRYGLTFKAAAMSLGAWVGGAR